MRERPILFSGPMVRAIMEGRKTQTRRLIKPQPEKPVDRVAHIALMPPKPTGEYEELWWAHGGDLVGPIPGPQYHVGQRLWVRETWGGDDMCGFAYRADHPDWPCFQGDGEQPDGPWRPSIFMPRVASRISLEITAVRVHPLLQTSEADAIAEGARRFDNVPAGRYGDNRSRWQMILDNPPDADHCLSTAYLAFGNAWNAINGKRAQWSSNPWVRALTFRRVS